MFSCCFAPAERDSEFLVNDKESPDVETSVPKTIVSPPAEDVVEPAPEVVVAEPAPTEAEVAAEVEKGDITPRGLAPKKEAIGAMSDVSNDSPGTKEQKKNTLKQLVRQFCKEAAEGFSCKYLDLKTLQVRPATLTLSKDKKAFSIEDKETLDVQEWQLADITEHMKGARDIPTALPALEENSNIPTACGVRSSSGDSLILCFDDDDARDKIFYVLRVLSLVVIERYAKNNSTEQDPEAAAA